jgi:hypothetical protein
MEFKAKCISPNLQPEDKLTKGKIYVVKGNSSYIGTTSFLVLCDDNVWRNFPPGFFAPVLSRSELEDLE